MQATPQTFEQFKTSLGEWFTTEEINQLQAEAFSLYREGINVAAAAKMLEAIAQL